MSIRKVMTIVLVFLLLLPIEGFGKGKPGSFKPGSEPEGFRGIKWGTDISTLKDMEVKEKDWYVRTGDKLKIGEAELISIAYGFYKGKFECVMIEIKGQDNFSRIRDICFELYGPVAPIHKTYHYIWRGNKTIMLLDTKSVTLSLWSPKYEERFEKEKQENPKKESQQLREGKQDF